MISGLCLCITRPSLGKSEDLYYEQIVGIEPSTVSGHKYPYQRSSAQLQAKKGFSLDTVALFSSVSCPCSYTHQYHTPQIFWSNWVKKNKHSCINYDALKFSLSSISFVSFNFFKPAAVSWATVSLAPELRTMDERRSSRQTHKIVYFVLPSPRDILWGGYIMSFCRIGVHRYEPADKDNQPHRLFVFSVMMT